MILGIGSSSNSQDEISMGSLVLCKVAIELEMIYTIHRTYYIISQDFPRMPGWQPWPPCLLSLYFSQWSAKFLSTFTFVDMIHSLICGMFSFTSMPFPRKYVHINVTFSLFSFPPCISPSWRRARACAREPPAGVPGDAWLQCPPLQRLLRLLHLLPLGGGGRPPLQLNLRTGEN